ncbi:MAG: DUF349 domain-containing protein [Balneolaceae bacterium]
MSEVDNNQAFDEDDAQDTQVEGVQISELQGDESPERWYAELAKRAEKVAARNDWPYVSAELDAIEQSWDEGPDAGEADISAFLGRIQKSRKVFEERKKEHFEEQKRIRQENLEKRKQLLQKIRDLVKEEKWGSVRDAKKMRARWDRLKPLPSGNEEGLNGDFEKCLKEYQSGSIERLVRKREKEEENLQGKLVILDKMDQLVKTAGEKAGDWKKLESDLGELEKEWRKIGRVPQEKNEETWSQYHAVLDLFHQNRFRFDDAYRQRIETALSKKKRLIQEAEALLDREDLPSAAREMNRLHKRWKKTENLPQREENELWDLFKKATDLFNDKKSENMDLLRAQEKQNEEERRKLIREAEDLKESSDWGRAHDTFQGLLKKWKSAGPIPRKDSQKFWKEFKSAMDHFYDRRREHQKGMREERKENLQKKFEILKELKKLKSAENPIEAAEEAKKLQSRFKSVGQVPSKHNNRLWNEFKEHCDVIFDRFRSVKSAAEVVGREKAAKFSAKEITEISEKQRQAVRLQKEIKKLSGDLVQMRESLSYFKPSGEGSSILDDVKRKIESAENTITKKEKDLEELEKEIDLMKRE